MLPWFQTRSMGQLVHKEECMHLASILGMH